MDGWMDRLSPGPGLQDVVKRSRLRDADEMNARDLRAIGKGGAAWETERDGGVRGRWYARRS